MNHADREALFIAAAEDDARTIREFARQGANLNLTWHGNFLLHNACETNSFKALRALLKYGADANRRFDYRDPVMRVTHKRAFPLLWARTPEAVRILVRYGADVNAASAIGTTALMIAANYGLDPVAACLLELGADPSIRRPARGSRKAVTALDVARNQLAWWSALECEEPTAAIRRYCKAYARTAALLEAAVVPSA